MEICFLSGLLHSHCSLQGKRKDCLVHFHRISAFPSAGLHLLRRKWVDILPDPNSRRVCNLSLVTPEILYTYLLCAQSKLVEIFVSQETLCGPICRKLRDIFRQFDLDLTSVIFTQTLPTPCALTDPLRRKREDQAEVAGDSSCAGACQFTGSDAEVCRNLVS